MGTSDARTIDRRRLLLGGALGGLYLSSPSARASLRMVAPASLAGAPKCLVLVQLSGGNDGLSTVVPYGDDAYAASREEIRVGDPLRLDDYRGLHPNLTRLRGIWEAGHLALVEGCGYPDPVRSHFRSLEIWHTAQSEGRNAGAGWIGRLAETAWKDDPTVELVVHVGGRAPYALYSPKRPPISFVTPQGYRWAGAGETDDEAYRRAAQGGKDEGDVLARLRSTLADADASSRRIRAAATSYRPRVEYPNDELATGLRTIAALIDSGLAARVYSLELDGFDTHETQKRKHDTLMNRLDRSLGAFYADLHGTAGFQDTLVLVFSEFGRRVKENGSKGTDHGVAAPVLVLGGGVKGGLYGRHPSLTELDDGDLVHTTDFRSVYGTVIERWFDAKAEPVLGQRYPKLDFLG